VPLAERIALGCAKPTQSESKVDTAIQSMKDDGS